VSQTFRLTESYLKKNALQLKAITLTKKRMDENNTNAARNIASISRQTPLYAHCKKQAL